MIDCVDPKTRARMMSGIKGKNTAPEMALRRALHARGLRYRLHAKGLPGRPDLVFGRYRAVVFVHGCFWHRHEGCRFTTTPGTRPAFWLAKFAGNVERDLRTQRTLREGGWRVAVVWECALRGRADAPVIAERVAQWLRSGSGFLEIS